MTDDIGGITDPENSDWVETEISEHLETHLEIKNLEEAGSTSSPFLWFTVKVLVARICNLQGLCMKESGSGILLEAEELALQTLKEFRPDLLSQQEHAKTTSSEAEPYDDADFAIGDDAP
jgi:hypothetical protein